MGKVEENPTNRREFMSASIGAFVGGLAVAGYQDLTKKKPKPKDGFRESAYAQGGVPRVALQYIWQNANSVRHIPMRSKIQGERNSDDKNLDKTMNFIYEKMQGEPEQAFGETRKAVINHLKELQEICETAPLPLDNLYERFHMPRGINPSNIDRALPIIKESIKAIHSAIDDMQQGEPYRPRAEPEKRSR